MSRELTGRKTAVIWVAVSSQEQAADDKVSLDEQLATSQRWADEHGLHVIKTFHWDGASRNESDPVQALEDYARKGWYHYHELRDMWRRQAFDVLICHSHSRLGRSFTMQSWVVENVIRSGAVIYRVLGGLITEEDYAGQIALGGWANRSESTRFVKTSAAAKLRRVQRGLSYTQTTMAHRKVRDPVTGREIGLALNEEHTALWSALADIILSGKAQVLWEHELSARGFNQPDGRMWSPGTFRKLVRTPSFWGHAVVRSGRKNRGRIGRWAYDRTVAPPSGITIFYDVYPPVYTGELADSIRAELIRRESMVGNRRPHATAPLSGLFQCAGCGHMLSGYVQLRTGIQYLRCPVAAGVVKPRNTTCEHSHHQRADELADWLNARLLEWIDAGYMDINTVQATPGDNRLRALDEQIATLEQRMNVLVEEMTLADEGLREVYRKQLRQFKTTFDATVAERQRLFYEQQQLHADSIRTSAILRDLRAVRELAVPALWSRADREINQFWRALLGDYVIVWNTTTHEFVRFGKRHRRSPIG